MLNFIVVCPTNTISGGTNSLHLLCASLNINGYSSEMYYYPYKKEFEENAFIKSFNVPNTLRILDNKDTVVIVPETLTNFLLQFNLAKKVIYWLSINFFIKCSAFRFPLNIKPIRKIISLKVFHNNNNFFDIIKEKIYKWSKKKLPIWNSKYFHISNSCYAASYLKCFGVNNIFILHNPVRQEFYSYPVNPQRMRLILFGPKTSNNIVKYIQRKFPEYRCIKLKRLQPDEVVELMRKAVVFVELGYHQGRDRMPREAVLSGCVVLISNRGSACFYEDVPMKKYYRIDIIQGFKKELFDKIADIINNYSFHYMEMQDYIFQLQKEHLQFHDKVKELVLLLQDFGN
jgi:hypothetical protein